MNTVSAAIIGASILLSTVVALNVLGGPGDAGAAMPAATAQGVSSLAIDDSTHRCLSLADDPFAPELGTGVTDEELDVAGAAIACQLAIESDPYNIGSRFRLGRVRLAQEQPNEAMEVLDPAVNAGHPGAMTTMVRAVLATGTDDMSILATYQPLAEAASDRGYAGAAPIVEQLAERIKEVEQAMLAAFDASMFENTEIMDAIWRADHDALNSVNSGFYAEDAGISKSLTLWVTAFADQLSSPYHCPRLLRAGIAARAGARQANQANDIVFRDPTAALEVIGDVLTGLTKPGSDPFTVLRDLNANAVRGQELTQALTSQGRKDALTVAELYGCTGPVSERIARHLADYFGL